MTTLVIIMISGIFAVAAIIGLIDLFVHLVCRSARSLRTPDALRDRSSDVAQRPAQGITA
jgi:hypothetical protein